MKDVFVWLDSSWLAEFVRASTWLFAFIEVIHLLGITLLLGMVSVLDFRVMGIGLRQQTVREVALDTYPWTILGVLVAGTSGIVLGVSEAMKLYNSPPFTIKMSFFVLALVTTYFFQKRMVNAKGDNWKMKLAALASLMLWFGVGISGRAIAFY